MDGASQAKTEFASANEKVRASAEQSSESLREESVEAENVKASTQESPSQSYGDFLKNQIKINPDAAKARQRAKQQELYDSKSSDNERYSSEAKAELKQRLEDEKKLSAAVTEDDKKLLWSGVRHMRRKIQSGGINVTLRSVIFHLGDLEMITIPGELFSTFGMEIKKNFNAPMRIVWGYANYSAGYIVEKDEFGKGYESMQTPFLQGEAELYIDHLIKSL